MMMGYTNFILDRIQKETWSNDQLIDINRMYQMLQQGTSIDKFNQDTIEIKLIDQKDLDLNIYLNQSKKRTVLLPANNHQFYQFTYEIKRIPSSFIWSINIIFLLLLLLLCFVFFYIRNQIILPFHRMEEMAEALKNRNYTFELPEQKSRYFGKFVWAIDLLKEELRYHEEKELQLMKEKKTMIASLSHDIKTPLANIRLYTDALKEHLYTEQQIEERIYEHCDKIDQYIKDIINTSQEDLFDFNVTMQEVYLHDVFDILNKVKERMELARISYEQHLCKDGLIYTDLPRLTEVIHNVIDNAIKYGDGKWIHVLFYEEDHRHILKITNSGMPIDVKDTNAIFQSFYRGSNVEHQKGNGLGLYICKQLMKQMDGDIFLTQENNCVSFHLVLGTV